ncbi:MAG: histidine phosphatase family protein [Pseudomonadota bacterium]
MGEIVLVRHGQANSAATDEVSYDRLSDLGRQQARWLGAWMSAHEWSFDHVLSGTLNRQRDTAFEMGKTPDEDPRLNELDYYTLSAAARDRLGIPLPGPEEFVNHMPRVIEAWRQAEIQGAEPYQNFTSRVREMITEAAVPGRRILCVTSGGVIGMILHQLLDLDLRHIGNVTMPIFNTSVHRLQVLPDRTILAGFNAIPHLETPDRSHARTYY